MTTPCSTKTVTVKELLPEKYGSSARALYIDPHTRILFALVGVKKNTASCRYPHRVPQVVSSRQA